jgi:hypothetical protein
VGIPVADLARHAGNFSKVEINSKGFGIETTKHIILHKNFKQVLLTANDSRQILANCKESFDIDALSVTIGWLVCCSFWRLLTS